MFVLIGSYLLLVFVLPVALSGIVAYRSLPRGRSCPQCRGDTLQLVSRPLHALSALHPHAAIQRRWCLCCNWEGATRLPRQSVHRQFTETRRPAEIKRRAVQPVRAAMQTLDVRSLDVDGAPWRVMLQCWSRTGLSYGRLMFVGPGGRLWLDGVEAFSGCDEREVLGQALKMPEPLLATRLRRLVSG